MVEKMIQQLVKQLNAEIEKQKLQGVSVKIQQNIILKEKDNLTYRIPQLTIRLFKEITNEKENK